MPVPFRPITSQTSYRVALVERKQDGAHPASRLASARRAVGLGDAHMRADPARLPHATGEFPAPVGAIAASYRLNLAADRAPGQNAVRLAEDLVGGVVSI